MITLLILSILFPLLLSLLALSPRFDRQMRWLFIVAFLPAIALALLASAPVVLFVPDILLGVTIGVDRIGRAFLALSAFVWLSSAIYSGAYFADPAMQRRYRSFFLLTATGNLATCLALDAATFYTAFAVMTLASYGLVTLFRNERSLSAGRYYLAFALTGEMLVLSGIVLGLPAGDSMDLAVFRSSVPLSSSSSWLYFLLFVGFGIKAGLVPLHTWLPRSYYTAPFPVVIVLSGAMSKAGVLGWVRFLPLGEAHAIGWSSIILAAGMLTAIYGALVGLVQTRARTALAFSSLSQMGYLAVIVGTALSGAVGMNTALTVVVAYTFHHGLTKAGLFLGVDLLSRHPRFSRQWTLVMTFVVIGAASLVGLPYTTGAYAKFLIKDSLATTGTLATIIPIFLVAGSCGTLLLMLRFIVLCTRLSGTEEKRVSGWISLAFLSGLALICGWQLPRVLSSLHFISPPLPPLVSYLAGLVPVALGALPAIWLTRKAIFQKSQMTPRPFDPLVAITQKLFGHDLPARLLHVSQATGSALRRLWGLLRVEERTRATVNFMAGLSTSWKLGTTLLLMTWLGLWIVLEAQRL